MASLATLTVPCQAIALTLTVLGCSLLTLTVPDGIERIESQSSDSASQVESFLDAASHLYKRCVRPFVRLSVCMYVCRLQVIFGS